jgi:hypothetical protein
MKINTDSKALLKSKVLKMGVLSEVEIMQLLDVNIDIKSLQEPSIKVRFAETNLWISVPYPYEVLDLIKDLCLNDSFRFCYDILHSTPLNLMCGYRFGGRLQTEVNGEVEYFHKFDTQWNNFILISEEYYESYSKAIKQKIDEFTLIGGNKNVRTNGSS